MEQVSSTPSANLNELKPQNTNSAYKITFRKIARAAVAEVRVHKKIAIISCVLFGVAMLLFMFNAHFYVGRYGGYEPTVASFEPSYWGIGFAAMGVLVGYFAALNVFRDVNNQQLCDVTMALPIKATERFFSKLLALFFLQTGPLILSTLGGNGIALLFGRISAGPLESEASEYLAALVFGSLSISLFIMAIAVLCTCCCGAVAESAYFSLILMFIINALPATFVCSIISECSGFENSLFYGSAENGLDVKFWGFLPLFSGYNGVSDFVFHNVISIAISLCVMFLSIFLYKRRDAKTVGTPIASRIFFEVIMALGCFTLFSFFVMTTAAWWGLLIAGVIYIIINVIVSRAKINVMSFFTWIVKYTVTTAVFVVFMVVTIKTGGLGLIYSRPAAEYLEGSQFSIRYYDYSSSTHRALVSDNLSAEQADQLMEICKKHIAKGRSELSAVSIMLGNDGSYFSNASVRIRAHSNKVLRTRPSPMRHFSRITAGTQYTGYYTVYNLDYNQAITISLGESHALINELQALDFIHIEGNGSDSRVVYDPEIDKYINYF